MQRSWNTPVPDFVDNSGNEWRLARERRKGRGTTMVKNPKPMARRVERVGEPDALRYYLN